MIGAELFHVKRDFSKQEKVFLPYSIGHLLIQFLCQLWDQILPHRSLIPAISIASILRDTNITKHDSHLHPPGS